MKNRITFLLFAILGCFAIAATSDIVIRNDSNGYLLCTSSAQKLGFHGAAPTIKRTGADQAAVSLTTGAALATTAATTSTPYGFSQAQADGLVARENSLRADNIALTALVNELRAALVAKGLIKGST